MHRQEAICPTRSSRCSSPLTAVVTAVSIPVEYGTPIRNDQESSVRTRLLPLAQSDSALGTVWGLRAERLPPRLWRRKPFDPTSLVGSFFHADVDQTLVAGGTTPRSRRDSCRPQFLRVPDDPR